MSSLVARGYVHVRADSSQLPGDFAAIKSMFRQNMTDIGKITTGILAAAGIRGLGGLVSSIGGLWLTASTQMENFIISLGVLLKDEKRAVALMREIEQMAAVTPFTTQTLTEAVIQLKVFGFETNKLIPMMRIIGDAAAASPRGMADGLQRISYALGQVNTAGKLSRRELRQLTMAGVAAWDFLAAKLGKTTAQVSDMVKKGQVSAKVAIETILEGMEKKFGGMMVKQSQTWTGLMSTMTDNLRIFSRQSGQPLFDVAKAGLKFMTEWFNTDKAKQWIGNISGGITYVIDLVKSGLASPWLPVAANIAKAALKAISLASAISTARFALGAAGAVLSGLLSPVGLLVSGATAFFYMLQQALEGPGGSKLRDTLSGIWGLTIEVGNNLKRAFLGFFDWLQQTWTSMFGSDLRGKSDSFMQAIMDGVKAVMYQVTLFTADFALTWEYLKAAAELTWLNIQDYASQAFRQMRIYAAGFVAGTLEAFKILDEQLGITLKINRIIEWATGARDSILGISATIMGLVSDFGSLAFGAYVMLEIGNMIAWAGKALAAFSVALNTSTIMAMLNPVGLLAIGIGVLGIAFIGARLEGVSFGEYVAMMLGRMVAGCDEAIDAVSRLKRSLKTEADFAGQGGLIDEAMGGEATPEKIKALEEIDKDIGTQEKMQKDKIRVARQAIVDVMRNAEGGALSEGQINTKLRNIESGKDQDSWDKAAAYRESLTDQKRLQERRKGVRDKIETRKNQLGMKRFLGYDEEFNSGGPLGQWMKRIREAGSQGMGEAEAGMPPGADPAAEARRKELQDRIDAAKGGMKDKQEENKRDDKSRQRWADINDRLKPLPALVEGRGGAGEGKGGLAGSLLGGAGGKDFGKTVGIVEFAKSLQSGLFKGAAEETADHTKVAAGHLGTIVTEGVKIKDLPPARMS